MVTAILILVILILLVVLSFSFKIIGSLLKFVLKLVLCLPCALIMAALGLVFCCTLLLIPVGIGCFKIALNILNPLKVCPA